MLTTYRTIPMELACGHGILWATPTHDDDFERFNAGFLMEDWCEECDDYRTVVG